MTLESYCKKHGMTELTRIDFMDAGEAFVNLACGCNHWLVMNPDSSELKAGKVVMEKAMKE